MNKYLITLFLVIVIFGPGKAQVVKQGKPTLGETKTSKRKPQFTYDDQVIKLKRCSAMEADATLRAKYPSIPSREAMEKELQKRIQTHRKLLASSRTAADEVIVIPVIVHVIHNGEAVGVGQNITAAQVKSQIDVLNEDYRRKAGTPGFNNNPVGADMQIEFALALRDPQGRVLAEPGVDRQNKGRATWNSMEDIEKILKPSTQWDPTKYLNMWTVTYGGTMEDNLGYAQFPVLSGLDGLDDRNAGLANTDGLVMRHTAFGRIGSVQAPYDQGRTTTHEIGHWLGLKHIWGDKDGCTGSDYCEDTPVAGEPNYRCTAGTNTCPNNPGNDMIENYMDYTNDACMNIFTQHQKERMQIVMQNCPRRKELRASTVHIPDVTGKPLAAFEIPVAEVCTGVSFKINDASTNNPTSWEWQILDSKSEVVRSSDAKNPSFSLNAPGSYSVVLTVKNAAGETTKEENNVITVLSSENLLIPYLENMSGESVLGGWSLTNPDNDRTWYWTDLVGSGNIDNTSVYFDNFTAETDPTGTQDALISPRLDLNANKFAELSFDLAYSMYKEPSDDIFSDEYVYYSDTLALYYSKDCGATFELLWKKWGADLATAPARQEGFEPMKSEWRREKISLTTLNGLSNVQLKLVNISGWGNYLFIDDLKIDVPVPTAKPVTSFSTTTRNICEGIAVKFTDNTTNNPRTWSWTFPGGTPATSTEQNPTVIYKKAGNYNVSLTTSNQKGNHTTSLTSYIKVSGKPTLSVTADKQNICDGDEVTLKASGGLNYIWKDKVRGDVIGNNTTIKVKPAFSTTYILEGVNTNGCSSTHSYEVIVKSPEKPTITVSNVNTLITSATLDIQWFLDNAPIAGATSRELEITKEGIYTVQTSKDGCLVKSLPWTRTVTGDDDHPKSIKSVTVYPNPAQSQITISINAASSAKTSKVILYNSMGVALQYTNLAYEDNSWKASFPVSQYASGTYFIRVEHAGKLISRTFIKQ